MNWKAYLLWLIISLTVMFMLVGIGGFLYGLDVDEASDETPVYAMILFLLAFIGGFFTILGVMIAAILIWGLIRNKYPLMDGNPWQKWIFPLYCSVFGLAFYLVSGINNVFGIWGSIFVCLSLYLPGLLLKELEKGTNKKKITAMEPEGLQG